MKIKILIIYAIILLTSFTSFCFAQENDYPNHKAFKLELEINDTNYFQAEIPESPIVMAVNSIQIYPGEELYIEVEMDTNAGRITNLKSVKKNLHPEKTLVISLDQISKKHIHESMVLTINNPFDMELAYKPSLLLLQISDWLLKNEVVAQRKQMSVEVFDKIAVSISLLEMYFKK